MKPPIYFYCVLHAKRGWGGVQLACIIAYVINGRPLYRNIKQALLHTYIGILHILYSRKITSPLGTLDLVYASELT